ncbi:MAG TPA: hypothetical protein VHA52_06375, partial [Candidatus Babeliaceae bacterium]|nr:hypothetical protein [Candidatus Babeliaceae bacterium]
MDLNTIKKSQYSKLSKSPSNNLFNIEAITALAQKDIKLFQSFGYKQKERFFSEVGMLLSAGVDLQTVLKL